MNEDAYRVVVAEDEYLLLKGLVRKIESFCPRFKVVGKASNGGAALELIDRLLPDLLITDIRMPGMDGIELIRKAVKCHPGMPIVIVSGYDDFEYVREALKLGVKDYLLKPVEEDVLAGMLGKIEIILDSNACRLKGYSPGQGGVITCSNEEIADIIELYIKENFNLAITLNTLSDRFNYSAGYISRIFKKYKSMPPLQYLLTVRINEAKRLLVNSKEMSIKQVSRAVGYSDQCYFSRLFRNMVGNNPSEYREKYQGI